MKLKGENPNGRNAGKIPESPLLSHGKYKSEADCNEKVLYCVLRKSRVVRGINYRRGREGWWLLDLMRRKDS